MKIRSLLWLVLVCAAANSFAWNDTGHMVTGAIAYRRLNVTAKTEANRLLQIGGDERTRDFYGACVWADDIRRSRPESGVWHYINYHFRTDGKATTNVPEADNVEEAIKRFSAIVKDKSQPDAERADALRFLIHFVGDAHQPLHAVARDTEATPSGDRGGNSFSILPPPGVTPQPKNLHSLWDEGAGLFNGTRRPLTASGMKKVEAIADTLTLQYGKLDENAAKDLNPTDWTHEGLALAKEQVYSLAENTTPTEDYLAAARAAAGKRIVLAGFRMANLLNKLLGS